MRHDLTYYVMHAVTGKFWVGAPAKWGTLFQALKFSSRVAALHDARPCGEPFVIVNVEVDRAGELVSVTEALA